MPSFAQTNLFSARPTRRPQKPQRTAWTGILSWANVCQFRSRGPAEMPGKAQKWICHRCLCLILLKRTPDAMSTLSAVNAHLRGDAPMGATRIATLRNSPIISTGLCLRQVSRCRTPLSMRLHSLMPIAILFGAPLLTDAARTTAIATTGRATRLGRPFHWWCTLPTSTQPSDAVRMTATPVTVLCKVFATTLPPSMTPVPYAMLPACVCAHSPRWAVVCAAELAVGSTTSQSGSLMEPVAAIRSDLTEAAAVPPEVSVNNWIDDNPMRFGHLRVPRPVLVGLEQPDFVRKMRATRHRAAEQRRIFLMATFGSSLNWLRGDLPCPPRARENVWQAA